MSKLETIIDEVRALPASDQIKLVKEISGSLFDRKSASSMTDFWNPRSLEEHIAAQGVQPIKDVKQLKGDFWPEDEPIEAFLAYTRRERAEALQRER